MQKNKKLSKAKVNVLGRLLKYLFKYYKWLLFIVILCLIIMAVGTASVSFFIQKIIDNVIYPGLKNGYESVNSELLNLLYSMAGIYGSTLIISIVYNQIMPIITQGFLDRLRKDMFSKMETLPISYFDQNLRGDIMSTYTNDVDAIRQLVSQSLPQLLQTLFTVSLIFFLMLTYSIYLTLLVVVAFIIIFLVTKKIGGGSAKYFIKQQKSIATLEGFAEEMMNGEKVIKVFTHEQDSIDDFNKLNEELNENSYKANAYANMLIPIIHNIGNILYVIVAIVGGFLYLNNVTNLQLTGFSTLEIGVVVSFLTMSRQFSNSFNQISNQLNSIVMALAGADRIFKILDEPSEVDDGYVTLVNASIDKDGDIHEANCKTGIWAWKHPHAADGTVTYTRLQGDIRFYDVDFGYTKNIMVLHDISLYAKPGEKIALVGATGAGKTTITNLITRFYDLADGKVRYDGININKIKKDDLRHSIGIVLQETSLFTGTVKENIRFGKLDATDEEIYAAAKIANAYDFITRLPQGFDTEISGNGANLSQGQRQLIAIARAAIADTPVMILDEATSSIDTHTEKLVQEGMDKLMLNRTVFVIAHRLSTVQNSNAIMVLDHGRIIERGDHNSLIAAKGVYYQLYTGAFELE
jgi:ATP-binding cassette subfamily B multidrug efflux pump